MKSKLYPFQEEEPRNGFLQRLMDPTVDRTIAIVAVLPMVWAAYYRYHHFGLNLPVIYYFINTFVLVLTMALRRPAKRITANPWFWLLAFVNTYFLVAILPFMDRGRPDFTSPIQCHRDYGFAGYRVGAVEPGTNTRLCSYIAGGVRTAQGFYRLPLSWAQLERNRVRLATSLSLPYGHDPCLLSFGHPTLVNEF